MDAEQFSQLLENAQAIRDMQKHPGWALWRAACERRVAAKQREMLAGKETLEEYRYIAGWIEGTADTLDAVGLLDRQIKRVREQQKTANGTGNTN